MDDGNPLLRVGIIIILIAIEAMITCAKTALEQANESVFRKKAEEEKDKKAELIVKLMEQDSWYINTAQMVSITVNVMIGALYSARLFLHAKDAAYFFSASQYSEGIKLAFLVLFTMLLLFVVILIGAAIPTRLTARDPDKTAYKTAGYMVFFIHLLRPFVALLNGAMRVILFILRINPKDLEDNVTEEEIISIVNEGFEQGVLEDSEVEMISNIIELDEKEVKDIMTHRKKVVSVSADMTIEEAIKFMLSESYSRFPLYEEEPDNIVGVIHLKDVTKYYVEQKNLNMSVKTIAREPYFVPDTQNADILFDNMQRNKIHMAVAVDEYGQMAGIVAMEDILEEIVGNIFDEYDIDERMIIKQGNQRYIMKGLTPIEDIEEELDIKVEQEDFDTLNGLLIYLLGHLPADKEKAIIEYQGYRFHIIDAKNNMIRNVKVVKETKKEDMQVMAH